MRDFVADLAREWESSRRFWFDSQGPGDLGKLLGDQKEPVVRECCERPPFKNYFLDLHRTVAAFELQTTGINWIDIRSEMKVLLAELEKYEANKLLSSANQVRFAFDRLRLLAPNGAERLTGVLRQHYLNSNFQGSISEGFLNRVMATSRVESDGVQGPRRLVRNGSAETRRNVHHIAAQLDSNKIQQHRDVWP